MTIVESGRDHVRVGIRCDAYEQISTGRIGLVVDSSGLVSLAVDTERSAIGIADLNGRVRLIERRLAEMEVDGGREDGADR